MNDLKEFLDSNTFISSERPSDFYKQQSNVCVYDLGLFFWERGGKQHTKRMLDGKYTPEEIIDYFKNRCEVILSEHNNSHIASNYDLERQNTIDCLACLGEEKVKELIKGVGKE